MKKHVNCFVEIPNDDQKILKYNYGEKSLKLPLLFMLTSNVCLKKRTHVKMILKNLIQRKKLSIHLLVTHCLQIVHLIQQKISLIVTEAEIVWESFVRTLESTQ